MAAASMKRAGNVSDIEARAIHTLPSSRGCRMTSSTLRGNSGSSSRNKTPLCARETSPGRGMIPPPIRPASEIVWCGARKVARRPARQLHRAHRPRCESWCLQRLFKRERRKDSGNALGQHGFTRAWRPDHKNVVSARADEISSARLAVNCPRTSLKSLLNVSPPSICRRVHFMGRRHRSCCSAGSQLPRAT